MRVLWFSNSPGNATDVIEGYGNRGGWISALDRAVSGKVELSVAFYHPKYIEPFQHNGTKYYPICRRNWKIGLVKGILLNTYKDKEDIDLYLEIIKQVQPDIIHIHGTENPYGCLINNTKTPIVISYQGSCTVYNHKYFNGIEKKYTLKRKTDLRSPLSFLTSKSYYQRYRTSLLNRDREENNLKDCMNIIGRTDWDRRITRILAPKSKYFHNDEILRKSFYEHNWAKPQNNKTVIHTTTGDALFKGFETICEALCKLNKFTNNVEWQVAGISNEDLITTIVKNKLKGSYPIQGLNLMGNLPEDILLGKMLKADIYVMPSHIENSPNSLCEAMMLGMPCISTYAGGVSSLLQNKEEGILIQDGDPWAMAGAILDLINDPCLAIDYGNKARIKALQRHDVNVIVSDLLNIYREVVNSN